MNHENLTILVSLTGIVLSYWAGFIHGKRGLKQLLPQPPKRFKAEEQLQVNDWPDYAARSK